MKLLFALFATFVLALPAHGDDSLASKRANELIEFTFTTKADLADPFNNVSLDVTFTDPAGKMFQVPAFWAGKNIWKVRYSSPVVGKHTYRTECANPAAIDLNGITGVVEITPYTGENPLYQRGFVQVAADKRHFQYADGTPFFWLGDTWWMGLCHRLHWPDDVKKLAADRKAKGFNVIQIVAGLYPDMHQFDPRGANEAGFPWEKDYARIRPEYFDAADQRIEYLCHEGFTPCIVGAWGYYMQFMGEEKVKQHWRYLIARYGAMPVVWCAGGEANLPWYLAKGFPYDDRKQVTGWTHVLKYIRETDPYRRPLTIHPTGLGRLSARNATDDASLLDFDMLQTPHGQQDAVAPTVLTMRQSYADEPVMPVIDGEASYEMLSDSLPTQWTRAMFWLCMTNGAAGHTYGANGIWQVNRKGQPHGPSPQHPPDSAGYGKIPWDEAMNLPGSGQLGFGKKLFEQFQWQRFAPQQSWASWVDAPGGNAPDVGDWIWYPEGDAAADAPVGARLFRVTFELPDQVKIKRAILRIAADDRCTVWINDHEAGTSADWHTFHDLNEIGKYLGPGRNVLAVRVQNVKADVAKNPAGLVAGMRIESQDGKSLQIKTDGTWRAASEDVNRWREAVYDDAAWKPAKVVAKFGQGPWGNIVPAGGGNPFIAPYATGIAREVRLIYVPEARDVKVRRLEPDVHYVASHFDPVSGERKPLGDVTSDADGVWNCRAPAGTNHDWVLILEAKH